jgi:hypothetical protein
MSMATELSRRIGYLDVGGNDWWRVGYHQKRGDFSMTKLDMLNAQRAEKFNAICALVARDLGYGELAYLSEEDRNHIIGEAKHYVELWEEAVEMKTSPTVRSITPLRRLLAEYHDTCERILDEQEIEIGLWAYKKRSQGPRRRLAFF